MAPPKPSLPPKDDAAESGVHPRSSLTPAPPRVTLSKAPPLVLDMPPEDEKPREPSGLTVPPRISTRPPMLASEILRADMVPHEPGHVGVARLLLIVGVVASVMSFAFGGASLASFLVCGGALLVCGVCLVELPFRTRARFVALVSSLGLVACVVAAQAMHLPGTFAWLSVATTWLAASLFFRAFHRGSKRARAFVALGLGGCVLWAVLAAQQGRFEAFAREWQLWLPTVLTGAFVMILVLSLLAFMTSGSTGGCHVWGALLLVWFAGYAALLASLQISPLEGHGTATLVGELIPTVAIGTPLFATATALALSQLLATARATELDGTHERS